jgi:hypothetical protein
MRLVEMPETETGVLAKIEDGWDCPVRCLHTSGILPFCLERFWPGVWITSLVSPLVLGMLGIVMVMFPPPCGRSLHFG